MPSTAADVKRGLAEVANPEHIVGLSRFFKTGPGEYGEGDVFIGVRVPDTRSVIKQHRELSPAQVKVLLRSKVHEHRLAGLLIWVWQFEHGDDAACQRIYDDYLDALHAGQVNNWDLVDSSACQIVGDFLYGQEPTQLAELAGASDLWVRRVGIIATFAGIKLGDPAPYLSVAPLVLDDRRDLIQKATGWMAREMGKRCGHGVLLEFLDQNAAFMGRTALSYATEHLETQTRARFRAL